MTAEVAILNKLGVALAADSAVTIGRGGRSQKVFNTADKLFELSCKHPIGCMIFSGGQFAEAPLPVLIKAFRASNDDAPTVKELAAKLLQFFLEFANDSPSVVKRRPIAEIARKITTVISERVEKDLGSKVTEIFEKAAAGEKLPEVTDVVDLIWETSLQTVERYMKFFPEAKFLGPYPTFEDLEEPISEGVARAAKDVPEKFKAQLVAVIAEALRRTTPYSSSTGIVVAGFGEEEIFPTLVHVEIFEPILGALKYSEGEEVDIGRDGPKARVLAFAQREMAERFLFGLDTQLKQRLMRFARDTVSSISESMFDHLTFADDVEEKSFREAVSKAENAYVKQFEDSGVETIRQDSQRTVEEMVEFMPKQDLAEFAEALVNLSSLQRRVNSGFETVGGPIDVAVISKAEGLVWVKRKHYFPPELNTRFFNRMEEHRCGT